MIDFKSEEQAQLQLVERDDLEDEEDCFESIEKLISQGINAGDVKKLQDAGIYTCNGLMMHTKKSLTGIKGLSEAKVEKICEAAEKLVNYGYITGSEVLLRRKSVIRITTGSQALDELLGGGIETLSITEAFGEFRSGKTQLAHTLCVSTQIIYARAYTYEHQFQLLLGLAAKMSEEPFRLLIVDSVIALFRVDFTGRGELADRQQKLAQMLSRITKIAEEFNVAVYMTNQVIADPGGGVFISDPKKPAGGHVLAHSSTIRLMFRKGKGEQRVCKVIDAPNLPEAEAISSL
ncbi:meiotic recombination protein DMC1 homolog isoform X2 [Magnolia sinica]|uniref:meiotic recombination protein DMC1 homolog isoform X2 n=1 Tax=Magnolia sinica TaxID=86752 RepID=UPI00265A8D02|nr:meiotic recombination protein DMC1 homolog isoform X2 [Magnolia sinica]